jgi:hypothetical protein
VVHGLKWGAGRKGHINRLSVFWEAFMKKEIILFILLALFVLLGAVQLSGQDKSQITVKSTELNNGVVILEVLKAGKAYELQCNQETPGCTVLKRGDYLMVELPKNFGMNDCKDVEVYPESPNPAKDKKFGEYCLIEK